MFTFLVESYPVSTRPDNLQSKPLIEDKQLYAASALAANSFARSAFAAGFPLFGGKLMAYNGTSKSAEKTLQCKCTIVSLGKLYSTS